MSRTYKCPRTSLEDSVVRDESVASLRMQKKIEKKKRQKRRKIETERSFKKLISFRDQQRARMA